jgi:exodeoxyribonuclease VII large subunit
MRHRLSLSQAHWRRLDQALAVVSPLAVLGRGFAMVSTADGRLVRQTADVQAGEALRVRVRDGEFGARVE